MSVTFRDGMLGGPRDFELRGGMLIYQDETRQAALVTVHEVETPPDGPPRLGVGAALSLQHAQAWARSVLGGGITRTVLPPEVLMWDGIRCAWWIPEGPRRIWFCSKHCPSLQDISRERVMQPPLLLVAEQGKLGVWALASSVRPDADTSIFQAPFYNVTAAGSFCPGTVTLPAPGPSNLDAWERVVEDSVGTFPLTPDLTNYPGGTPALWRRMREIAAADLKPPLLGFPADSLVPTGLTVLDAINNEIGPSALPAVRERCLPERTEK